MTQFRQWLAPPFFPDDEIKTRHASLLHFAILTNLFLAFVYFVSSLIDGRTSVVMIGDDVTAIILYLLLWRWMRQGAVRAASVLLVAMNLIGTTLFIAEWGTIQTPVTAFYLLIAIFGGLLFGVRGIILTTASSSLMVLGLIVAQNAGYLPQPDYTVDVTEWFTYTALLGFSGGLTCLALESLRQALRHADKEIAERKRVEAELQHRNRELLVLNQAGQTLTASLDLDQVLKQLLDQVDELFEAVSAFWLLEPAGDELICRHATGPASAQVCGWRLRLGEGIAGWVAQTGESAVVPDVADDPRHFKGMEQKTGMMAQSILCVPLKTHNRVIGVLQVMDTQAHRFDPADLTLAESLAATAVIAIENARLYAEGQQATKALLESEARWQFALEGAGDGVWDWNLQTNHVYYSRQWKAMLGYTEDEISNSLEEWDRRVHPDDVKQVYAEIEKHLSQQVPIYVSEHRVQCKNGTYKWILDRGKMVERSSDGKPLRMIGTHTNITERKHLEQELEKQRDFALRVMNVMGQGLTITNSESCFEFVNPAYSKMMGYTPDELVGKRPRDVTMPEDIPGLESARAVRQQGKASTYESRLVRKDGGIIPVLITGVPRSSEGEFTGSIAVITDLTEQKRTEVRLRYLGMHDALTGIGNRAFFEEELVRLERSSEFPISIVVIDVDNMKKTNDTLGHAAGDKLLISAARILQSVFRASDILARIGGDEFAVILPKTENVDGAQIIERIRQNIIEFNQQTDAAPLSMSLGIASATSGNLSESFKLADAQMYADKRSHKK